MMFIQFIRSSVIFFKSTRMRIRSLLVGQEKESKNSSVDARQRRLDKKNEPAAYFGLWFYRNQKYSLMALVQKEE